MLHLQLRYMETCGEFMQIDPFIQALLHGMIGIGLIGTLSKLHKWDESAMFFDGSSLGMIPWLWVGRAVLTPFIFVDSRLCLQHCALRDGYNSFTANNRDPTPRRNKGNPSTSFERPLRRKCDYHSLPTGRVGTPGMNPLLSSSLSLYFLLPFWFSRCCGSISYYRLQAGQEYAHRQDAHEFTRMKKGAETSLKKDQ